MVATVLEQECQRRPRVQEQIEERESERRRRAQNQPKVDPEKLRQLESLRLARAELQRQSGSTTHPVRRQQIQAAIAEIDKRLSLESA